MEHRPANVGKQGWESADMVAGRGLDEKIAVELMGLVLRPFEKAPCPYCGDGMRFCGGRSWCTTCGEWRYGPAKEYSEEIEPAWEVVEKLRTDGYTVMVTTSGHEEFAHVMVYKTKPYGDNDELRVMDKEYCEGGNGDTVMLAICLAARAAVGALPPAQKEATD